MKSTFHRGVGERVVVLQGHHLLHPRLVKPALQQDAAHQAHIGGVPHGLPHLGDAQLAAVLFTVITVDPTTWSRSSSTSTQSHCWDRAR